MSETKMVSFDSSSFFYKVKFVLNNSSCNLIVSTSWPNLPNSTLIVIASYSLTAALHLENIKDLLLTAAYRSLHTLKRVTSADL